MKMTTRTSSLQFEIMLDYFEDNPELLSGKVDAILTKEIKDEKWKELTYALNAQEGGPKKTITGWRKTLKDWKCYVKKKAHRIALEQEETGCINTKDKLSSIEEKLLVLAGERIPSKTSDADEDDDVDESIDSDDMDIREFYLGRKKAIKRKKQKKKSSQNKIRESLLMGKSSSAEAFEKLYCSQNKSKESNVVQKRPTLLEQELAFSKRRALASERKAAAEEKLVLLKEKKLHLEWRKQMQTLRMKKLEFL